MLASRLASHALAACSTAAPLYGGGLGVVLQLRSNATAAPTSSKPSEDAKLGPSTTLTEAQRQQLNQLLAALQRSSDTTHRLGMLTGLAVAYRDLSVAMTALQMRERGHHPFADDVTHLDKFDGQQPAASSNLKEKLSEMAQALALTGRGADQDGAGPGAAVESPSQRGLVLEMKDVTEIDDHLQVDGETPAPEELELEQAYMDKVSCWAALQPNHMEVSQALMTGVKLFPPTEATYPTFVDFDAALRKLRVHVSGKRLRLQQRLRLKQDKYQLKTWEHSPGEA